MRTLLIAAIGATMLLSSCASSNRATVTPEVRMLHDGLAAYRQGQIKRAGQLFAKILTTEPNNPYAHLNLGAVKGQMGDRNGAIAHYNKAIETGEGVTASQVLPGAPGTPGKVINQRKSVADVARANLKRLGA